MEGREKEGEGGERDSKKAECVAVWVERLSDVTDVLGAAYLRLRFG